MKMIAWISCFAMFLCISCDYVGARRVRGNGNLVTEDRNVGSFTGVRSSGSFDLYVSSAATNSVKIEAEENLQSYIETYLDGTTLKIDTKDGYWLRPKKSIKVYVASPQFRVIHSSGSGDIIGQNRIGDSTHLELGVTGSANIKVDVDAPEIESEITGSGDMSITGKTRVFKGDIRGSGSIKAFDLMAEETHVRISGSGDADVFASVKLDVNVAGSGNVRYKGGAQVTSNIAGSGGVRKVD